MGLRTEKAAVEAEIRRLQEECDQKIKTLRAQRVEAEDTFQIRARSYKFVQVPGSGDLINLANGAVLAHFYLNGKELSVQFRTSSYNEESIDALAICKSLMIDKQ